MEPELSVIVPVLDEEKYLEATLVPIKDQNTNKPYEMIVSDNGSTTGAWRSQRGMRTKWYIAKNAASVLQGISGH